MYKISLPVMLHERFEEYFPETLRQCLAAGVERVYLCVSGSTASPKKQETDLELVRRYVPKLLEAGIEPGVWFSPLGHGSPLAHEVEDPEDRAYGLTPMRALDGRLGGDALCPADEKFRALSADWIKRLAATGTRIIMLDDDFRYAFRAGDAFCCCDKHIALLEKELGEPFDAARMRKALMEGAPNHWRDVWLRVQGRVLNDFALEMRAALDTVDPTVRLLHCSVLSTWDVDGVDSLTLAKSFAGSTRPMLRLIGAPYWPKVGGFEGVRMGTVCEYERLQQHWAKDSGVEIFCEGDVYPRPRYVTEAAYLEGFDEVMRAAGTSDGILKYMLDYSSSPTYETGYMERHLRHQPLYEKITAAFGGRDAVGVSVFEPMKTMALATDPGPLEQRCIPTSLRFVTDNSLPVRYDAGPDAAVIFGDAAELVTDEQLAHGTVLDAAAARILLRRGFDIGVTAADETFDAGGESYPQYNEYVSIFGGLFAKLVPAAGAEQLTVLHDGVGGTAPGTLRYVNGKGQRFLIYAFVARGHHETGAQHGVLRGWCRAALLRQQLPWLSGRPLDAVCDAAPDLYMLAKRDENGLTVGLWNFGLDEVFRPVVHLGEAWQTVEDVCGGAVLDGKTVTLEELPAFGFACFTVKK